MTRDPIERYLTDLSDVRGTRSNVPETSFYPALERLLTEVGQTLTPKVRCVVNLANRGAGIPDGGLFTADQFKRQSKSRDRSGSPAKGSDADPFPVQLPARGAIEAKAPAADLEAVAASEQVGRYWRHYGLVLVTNFRAFTLIGRDAAGRPAALESFVLGATEAEFWRRAAHPRQTADAVGERFLEYLKRVMLHNAPLTSPQDVAALLASYAHDARLRIEHADLPALAGLRTALEQALGLRFEDARGEHFFRSTLIQTLFYGVFSAWVLWSRRRAKAGPAPLPVQVSRDAPDAQAGMPAPPSFASLLHSSGAAYHAGGPFDWRVAHHLLRVPVLRALFTQVADPARLGALGLTEVLDWTAAALNRVDRPRFFATFDEGHAVQYFYEPFLQAFDPELRKDLGVWYTPEEIVRYQVERVDALLRSELGLADGLADPQVVVLDPCCGTGAYLRAVLRRIAATLHGKGGDALVAHDLKQAAMTRILGFEIMPAPFVVAHLQLGLELEALGAPLGDSDDKPERAAVYLTNSLTGWEPPREPKTHLLFSEMEEERDAADRMKQGARILVILGNPPYNGFAGVAVAEERSLSDAYRTTLRAPAPQGQGLNDLYVRFFRMAERRIAGMNRPAQGVVSFISNYSWLDGLSFTGMRERYLDTFDSIRVDCLNGDKYKTGKLTPEGDPDPSVFSTEYNREGIQVGTAIATLLKRAGGAVPSAGQEPAPLESAESPPHSTTVLFRHFWGKNKRAELLADKRPYKTLAPAPETGFPFLPSRVAAGYVRWPLLPSLLPTSFPGVKTSRDDFLVDVDRDRLEARLRAYFDPALSHAGLRSIHPGILEDTGRYRGEETRNTLCKRGFLPARIVRYGYRPFDVRWLYWEPETKLLDEKRSEYVPHVFEGNAWISAGQRNRKEAFYQPQFTTVLSDHHLVESNVGMFPLLLHSSGESLLEAAGTRPNLSEAAAAYLAAAGLDAETLFFHILATLHAPAYRSENGGALRQDWPRVPLPGWGAEPSADGDRTTPACAKQGAAGRRRKSLQASAALGRQVAALLDTERPVPGVTSGPIREELRPVAVFRRLDGKPANPGEGDLDLTAGWGHAGKGGVTMPGRGRAARTEEGCDIFLNDRCCWRDVPAAVWEYTLGGYPVLKKWLSYREKPLLGRGLRPDEVRHFTETARRIAALLALQPELDANYRAVKEFHDPCPRSVNIFPDYGCTYAWDEGGSCLGLAEQWPDIPELADLEENLVAWAETYERAMSGVSEVLEVYDAEDTKRHFTRGKALAQELARLLAPKGVSVSYYGNSIVF